MKKAESLLLMTALVTVFCLVSVSPVKATFKTSAVPNVYSMISATTNNTTNDNTILIKNGNLPSPLIIAALIIALVALFGATLSLYLRWRDKKLKQ